MIKRITLIGALFASSLLYGEMPNSATGGLAPQEVTQTTLIEQFKTFKQECDESGATAITQNILMGIGIQCALVFGWNNQLTQEAVATLKQTVTDFCIKHGINNVGFINAMIAGINQTFSLETIPTTGKTYFYTSVFTHLMELASDPIACSIWYMIFYKAVTLGPLAVLAPQTLLATVFSGVASGLISEYASTTASTAVHHIRGLIAKTLRRS